MSLIPIFSPTLVVSVSFAGAVGKSDDLTTYTFSSAALGTAAANRKVVVAACSMVTARTVSSMTINGISASEISGTYAATASTVNNISMWQADVPTGTTGDIVVTWSGAQNRCGIGVWAVYGAAATAHATATDTTSPWSQSVAVPAGGILIAAVSGVTATARSWDSPQVEDYDDFIEADYQSGAHYASAAGETVSVVMTPNSGTPQHAMAACSFGPA